MGNGPVVITGATGFIGQHLVAALLRTGRTVIALHRRASTRSLAHQERLLWTPIADAGDAFRRHGPEAVIHLATCYGTDADLAEVVESNVVMPLRLLQLGASTGCALFINTDTFFGKPEFDYAHMRPYIRSKDEFMRWASLANECGGPKLVNARLEHVYGPGDGNRKFVPTVLDKLLAHEPIELTPGDQLRDFVHVDDVTSAYLALLDLHARFTSGITEIGVGTGTPHSVREFVEAAKFLAGSSSALHFGAKPHRDGEIERSAADISRLCALGWRPRHDLQAGLRATLKSLHATAEGTSDTAKAGTAQ